MFGLVSIPSPSPRDLAAAGRKHRGPTLPTIKAYKRRLFAASFLVTALLTTASARAAASPAQLVDIPAGPLGPALQTLAAQTHIQLMFSSAIVAGHRASALKGRFTTDEALERLLAGTDIHIQHQDPSLVILEAPAGQTLALPGPPFSGAPATSAPLGSPQGSTTVAPDGPADVTAPVATSETKPTEVVVTGTHIRGVRAIASPTLEITADDLVRQGDATAADALERLPQNFNGQATPISSLLGSDRAETNTALSQGVNLRGLGASATLVLINGRRMAGSGQLGDFADVSSIPTAAVDHIEVLLDGASAIYGSDAVGGVVNVIMKHDFSGAETSLRYGVDSGGVGGSVQFSQTFGLTWTGGHALFAYEYQHDDAIPASARPYTADADLTRLGGTNHDIIYGSPGNILALNAAGSAYVAAYAIPGGSGVGLTPADFTAGTSNLFNFNLGTDLTPAQERNGFYLDLAQDLDPRTTVDLQARYNLRVFHSAAPASETILQVTNANPYFVSVNGETSDLIGYSLYGADGAARTSGTDKNFDLSLGLSRDVGRTWRIQAYAGYAEEVGRVFYSHVLNSDHLNEALGTTPDNPATGFSTATDGFFNPYGSGSSNAAAVVDFVTDGYGGYVDTSQIATLNLQADGTLLQLPGGAVKGAFGVQYRHERFDPNLFELETDEPFNEGGVAYTRDVASAFGELNIPIVGSANARPGLERLELSIAGRIEHYSDVGTTANPKVGLVWKPIGELSLHATYGTSFRAPALSEIGTPTSIYPQVLPNGSSQAIVLLELGGNPDLKPQTATTWTAGFDYRPAWLKGAHFGASWFDIDFTNQIGQPGVANVDTVLTDPAFASVVTRIDNTNPADEAKVQALLNKAGSSLAGVFPLSSYSAIVDGRYVNSASLVVSGVDFNADYTLPLGPNRLTAAFAGSYLYDYTQRQTPQSAPEKLLSTAGYPVDFRGRVSLGWTRGPYEALAVVNFVDSYRDPTANRLVAAWTTLDLSLSWKSPAASGPFKGLTLTAAAQNVFDQDPPFYDSYLGFGFDPANANPFGRVVSVRIDKRW